MANITTECQLQLFSGEQLLTPKALAEQALREEKLPITFSVLNNNERQLLSLVFKKDRKQFSGDVLGKPSTSSLESACHFSGLHDELRQALSACDTSQISGLIVVSGNSFSLVVKDDNFYLLPHMSDSCDLKINTKKRSKREEKSGVRTPAYIGEMMDGRWRYVELALVADYSMYDKFKSNEKALNDHLHRIVNIMNTIYYPLHIRITLVYTEIWTSSDKIPVVADATQTLADFMVYRKALLKDHPHDNAHLLTDVKFGDGVVGKAYRGTMCSYDYSGGVFMDHSSNAAIVAGTVAHEMGHNFGMDHDADPKTCNCPVEQCIMSPQSGHLEYWSECSVRFLSSGINRGIDICLLNEPGVKPGDAICGNGIIEAGEECDCGRADCNNKCCDGKTCKLIGEAVCAGGECCDLESCKPKTEATVCRESTGLCDLEEFCNGETADCPADFFVQNGHKCPGRENEFCYEGTCGSRNDKCSMLWGPTGQAGHDQCYRLNLNGKMFGNCGYDVHTDVYTPCRPEDQMCGLLHCETEAERPIYGSSNSITSMHVPINIGQEKKYCYVVKSTYVTAKRNDPGLVPDGATCGAKKMCVGAKCKPHNEVIKLTASCEENCHDRGTCNNVGNCHCERGFGGTACEIPGYGGSVNSNQAYKFRGITLSSTFLVLFVLLGFAIAGICIYYRYKRNRNLIAEFWKYMKKTFDLHGTLVPVRKAPPPPKRPGDGRDPVLDWGMSPSSPTDFPIYPIFTPPAIPLVSFSSNHNASTLPNDHGATATFGKQGKVIINRTASLSRPKEQPPSLPSRPKPDVIEKLYEERGAELGLPRSKPTTFEKPLPEPPQDERTPLRRVESMSRPDKAPPPPPKKPTEKPVLPTKPPKIAEKPNEVSNELCEKKVDVKGLAAKFDHQRKKS